MTAATARRGVRDALALAAWSVFSGVVTTAGPPSHVDPGTDVLTVRVIGDLDMATTEAFLSEAVARLGVTPLRQLEIDMSAASFVDSTGIAALVELRRAAHTLGARTRLVNVDQRTVRLLAIVGLDTVFLAP